MHKDSGLRQLRPKLALPTHHATPEEQFQNNSLRPILKLQHDLLLVLFEHYIQKRKNTYATLSIEQKKAWIDTTLKTDQKFRNLMAGTIIGHFTADELRFYVQNEAEVTRRLCNLLIQRLQSTEQH